MTRGENVPEGKAVLLATLGTNLRAALSAQRRPGTPGHLAALRGPGPLPKGTTLGRETMQKRGTYSRSGAPSENMRMF